MRERDHDVEAESMNGVMKIKEEAIDKEREREREREHSEGESERAGRA